MLTIFDQLQHIKDTGRQREKVALLKKYDSPTLRDALFNAFSPTVTFGVGLQQFNPEADLPSTIFPSITEFLSLIRKLVDRELTGDSARLAVRSHIESYPAHQRALVASFFAGRLSIGCDAEIINRALPRTIPVFGVQLAREFSADHMVYPAYASSKLDGMRCLIFVTHNGVKLLTRTGKAIECLPHLQDSFTNAALGIYDGELLHEDGDFNLTVSLCRKSSPDAESPRIKFHCFDYIPLAEWENPVTTAKTRFARLDEIHERYISKLTDGIAPTWFTVPHVLIKNSLQLATFHDQMIESGYEGTMVQFDRPYNKKRTYDLMKLKEFTSTEAEVYGWEPGTGKYKGMIGALLCRDTKSGVVFKCGSGFSDAERQLGPDYWKNKIIEVKFQELTPDLKPRFPTFLRERNDLLTETPAS